MSGADVGSIRAQIILETDRWNRDVRGIRNDMSMMGRASSGLKKALKGAGLGMVGVAAGVGMATAASLKAANDFETALASVEAKSGASAQEMELLKDAALEAGKATQFSASESADALTMMAAAGFSAQQMLDGLPGILSLAATENMSLAQASDVATNILSGFNMEAAELPKVADVLAKASSSSNSSVAELGESFKMIGPLAANLGFSLEETAGALAVLHDNGLKGSMAGTALRSAFTSLLNPSKANAEIMKKLGISLTDTEGKMKTLPQVVGNLSDATKDMTDADKAATIAKIVGTEAVSGMMALMAKSEDGLASYTTKLENSSGAAQQMADVMTDTTNGATKEFQSAVENLAIQLGEKLAPAYRDTLEGITGFLRQIKISDEVTATSVTTDIKKAESQLQVARSTDHLIDKFGALMDKSKLTTDEFGDLIDTYELMGETTDQAKLSELTEQFEGLRKKSGLSKDEMSELLGINSELIELMPEATNVVSDNGNAYASSAEQLRKYNDEKIRSLEVKLDEKIGKAEENRVANLIIVEGAEERINNLIETRNKLEGEMKDNGETYLDLKARLEEKGGAITRQERDQLANAKEKYKTKQEEYKEAVAAVQEEEKKVDIARRELTLLDEASVKRADIYMKAIGLTAERGKELKTIREAIGAQDEVIEKLEATRSKNGELTKEEQAQLETAQEKKGLLADTLSYVSEIIGQEAVANETANILNQNLGVFISKKFKVQDQKPYAQDVNNTLAEYIFKNFDIQSQTAYATMINDELMREIFKEFGITDQESYISWVNTMLEMGVFKDFDISDRSDYATNINDLLIKSVHKPFTVDDRTGYADTLNQKLSMPISKGVSIIESISRNVTTNFYGGNRPQQHQGGIARDAKPKFHEGGVPALREFPRLHNEVDIRALKNEMILTEAQQSQLFRLLSSYTPASNTTKSKADGLHEYTVERLLRELIKTAGQNGNIYMDNRKVAEALRKPLLELESRDQYYQDGVTGRRGRFYG